MAKKTETTAIEVFQRLEAAQAEIVAANPEVITAQIQENIMGAETVADVLDEGTTADPMDWLGKIIQLRGFYPRRGDFVTIGGEKWYVVLDAIDVETGEIITPPIATGGSIVLTQLAKLALMNAFPVAVRFTAKSTSSGTEVLRLIPGEAVRTYEGEEVEEAEVSA